MAPELSSLVEACPSLKLLVTSRERLRVRGEVEYPVLPLAEPEAVDLFCARAGAAPDETVLELCRALDNLPLALELAAARASVLSPRQILERLFGRLDVLKGGRDADPRQETLRATIEWSYELLGPGEQRLFARLSVFAGGCTVESAREVAKAELDTLQSLVDKSLLRHRDERFWMLETIREYAAERLDERGETEHLLRRHAEYFVGISEEAELDFGRDSQEIWFGRFDTEHGNFQAALRWAIRKGDANLAMRLGGALWQLWRSHGNYTEGRTWLREALAIKPNATLSVRAKAVWGAAALAYHQGDYPEAERLTQELLALARRTGAPFDMRNALTIQGVVAMMKGRFSDAVEPLQVALDICSELGSGWLLATSHVNLGAALMHSGDAEGARSHFEHAGALYRDIGEHSFVARATEQLAYLALQAGDRQEARSLFTTALESYRDLDDRWGVAEALEGFSA